MPTNSNATTSLICGIISLFCCGMILGPIAILKGLEARREIAAGNQGEGAAEGGDVMALIGIVLGGIGTAFWILGLITRLVLASQGSDAGY